MTTNDAINAKIREMIDEHRTLILGSRGIGDMEAVTYDGIVKEGNDPPAILFLLKEPNDGRNSSKKQSVSPDDMFSFVNAMREEAKAQQNSEPLKWKNLCYWARAYYDAVEGTPHSFNHPSVLKCGSLLGEIAFANIKKVAGAERITEEFDKTVNNPKLQTLIRNEVNMIAPQIVVCCGTYRYAVESIFKSSIQKQGELDCGVNYFVYNQIFFVDFIHPSQQGAAAKYSMTYAYAKEVFRDLVDKMRKE